jgi:hypothetical protein
VISITTLRAKEWTGEMAANLALEVLVSRGVIVLVSGGVWSEVFSSATVCGQQNMFDLNCVVSDCKFQNVHEKQNRVYRYLLGWLCNRQFLTFRSTTNKNQ